MLQLQRSFSALQNVLANVAKSINAPRQSDQNNQLKLSDSLSILSTVFKKYSEKVAEDKSTNIAIPPRDLLSEILDRQSASLYRENQGATEVFQRILNELELANSARLSMNKLVEAQYKYSPQNQSAKDFYPAMGSVRSAKKQLPLLQQNPRNEEFESLVTGQLASLDYADPNTVFLGQQIPKRVGQRA